MSGGIHISEAKKPHWSVLIITFYQNLRMRFSLMLMIYLDYKSQMNKERVKKGYNQDESSDREARSQ
jgi:hypothetical protein